MNELDDTDQEARAQLLAPKLCKGMNTVEARNACEDLYAWYGPIERNTVINRAQWLAVNEPATYCPDWIYETRQDLDLHQIEKLGSARPVWTHHFTTWQAFKTYVSGVSAGKRDDYPTWYAPEDWVRACSELDAERPQVRPNNQIQATPRAGLPCASEDSCCRGPRGRGDERRGGLCGGRLVHGNRRRRRGLVELAMSDSGLRNPASCR